MVKIIGSLDRVAHGLLAEDILLSTDEIAGITQSSSNNEIPSIYSQTIYTPSAAASGSSQITLQQNTPVNISTPMLVSIKSISNQTIALAHILQKRNFSNSIKAVNQKNLYRKDSQKSSKPFLIFLSL